MTTTSGTEADYNPLAGVSVVNNMVLVEGEGDVQTKTDEQGRNRIEGTIRRVFSEDRFNRAICGVLGWIGRRKGLKSLQVEPTDEDFQAATEVIYRRILDSGLGPVLDHLSDKGLEDIIIIFAGFGPVAVAVADELKERNKAEPEEVDTNEPN